MKQLFNFIVKCLSSFSALLVVALVSMKYIPDHYFNDFPLDPVGMDPVDFSAVIPEWNTKLSDNAEYIQLNQLLGPESVAISKGGLLYTGLADGRLIELDSNNKYKMRVVLRMTDGQNVACKDFDPHKPRCGRLLQLRLVNDTLYGVEAQRGLFMFDVKAGKRVSLGPERLSAVSMFNSFAFDPIDRDVVYISISSTKWNLWNFMWAIFDRDSSGQLMAYNVKTAKRVIIASNLSIVNGVDVDTERDRLIFTETLKGKVSYIQLSDVRAQLSSALDKQTLDKVPVRSLINLLPGYPDNIVIKGNMAYIAVPFVRRHGNEAIDHLGNLPKLRLAIGRATYLVGTFLEHLHLSIYPDPTLEFIANEFKSGHIHYRTMSNHVSGVIEYNLGTGASRLLGSDKFNFISEASPDGRGNLYLGTFRERTIVKVKIG